MSKKETNKDAWKQIQAAGLGTSSNSNDNANANDQAERTADIHIQRRSLFQRGLDMFFAQKEAREAATEHYLTSRSHTEAESESYYSESQKSGGKDVTIDSCDTQLMDFLHISRSRLKQIASSLGGEYFIEGKTIKLVYWQNRFVPGGGNGTSYKEVMCVKIAHSGPIQHGHRVDWGTYSGDGYAFLENDPTPSLLEAGHPRNNSKFTAKELRYLYVEYFLP